MSLSSVVSSAVAVAHSATAGVQRPVTLERWIGQDSYGAPQYSAPVSVSGLVQEGATAVRTLDGETVPARACVVFLSLPAAHGAAGRREPVDPRDRVTLPSGLTGPIVDTPSLMVNPETSKPYVLEVWIK